MSSRSVYFGVFSNVLGNFIMLGATVALTHILSAQEFGEFRVSFSFSVLMVPFLALGGERILSMMLQKGEPDQRVGELLATVVVLAMGGAFFLLLCYPLLSMGLFDGNVGFGVYVVSILLIPITIIYNFANTIWRHIGSPEEAQVHLNLIQRLLRAPALISATLLYPTAYSASLAMILSQAVSLFHIKNNFSRYMAWFQVPTSRAMKAMASQMGVVGLPIAFMASVDRVDVLLVNNLIGVAAAGTYDLVYMLSLTALFPAMAMSKTSEPILLKLTNDLAMLSKVKKLQRKTFVLSMVSVMGVVFFAPLISAFLGNAGPNSGFAEAVILMSAGLAFSSIHGPVLEYMQINGRGSAAFRILILVLIIFFVLKLIAAYYGSMINIAALAGLFYFVFRSFLAAYIYSKDGLYMGSWSVASFSVGGYIFVAIYIVLGA